jgi:phosphoglycolate phosphatase
MTSGVLRAVLFDFDFTLGDSSEAIIDCVGYGLRGLGRPEAAAGDVRACIGLTLPEVLRRLSGPCELAEIEQFVVAFHRRADEVMEQTTIIFPEGLDLVRNLRMAGIRTGIVSTKIRSRIEAILARRELQPLFDTIVGFEDVHECKPNPAGLLMALERLKVRPEQALYIGDHLVDAEAACRAGVPFVGVLTGTTTRACFEGRSATCLPDLNAVAKLLRNDRLA